MATDRLLECLSEMENNFSIQVIGDESEPAYNRIMLSSVLATEKSAADIQLKQAAWYKKQDISIAYGDPVVDIDLDNQQVTTKSAQPYFYDKLVFATGSRASLPNIPGSNHESVRCFRNMQDVDFLLKASANIKSIAIVGGGLLGLEAAHGMNLAGVQVHLVHRRNYLMNRQLDLRAGQLLQKQLEDRGIQFYMGKQPQAVNTKKSIQLLLDDGSHIEADLVIFAAGITPNKEIAETAGIDCNRAICVDDAMQTNATNVFAIGECTEHQNRTLGLVAPVNDQAKVLAENLLDLKSTYQYQQSSTVLKVSGIEMFSAGKLGDDKLDTCERNTDKQSTEQELQIEDPDFGLYRHLRISDNKLKSAVLLGDKRSGSWYEQLIENQQDISQLIPEIIFGRDYCQTQGDQSNSQVVEVIQ